MNRFSPKIFYADYVQKADVEKAAKVFIFKKKLFKLFCNNSSLNYLGIDSNTLT